jgi:hypothetical protein
VQTSFLKFNEYNYSFTQILAEFCFPSKDSALFLQPQQNNNGFVEQNLKN